ncbi:MAG: type I phosphomannose isomerase catalytic subunit [Planctomycetaceae bacterium]
MLPPLYFTPYLRQRIWGGTRLRDRLGRDVPADALYGESWELSALPEHDSVVAEGPQQGQPLSELWARRQPELYGTGNPPYGGRRFPLLIKWLDCSTLLSVQVHPDDADAQRLLNEPCGKAEAWVFLEADPGCSAYFGVRPETTAAEFARSMREGTVEDCLQTIHPRPGDVLYVPPGSVHALGAGQLLLEVEQPSDATFRVFDYNRPGPDGQPRELHHEQSLAVMDWQRHAPPSLEVKAWARSSAGLHGETLVQTSSFAMHRVTVSSEIEPPLPGRMSSWTVFAGAGRLRSRATGFDRELRLGDTVLIPASCPDAVWSPGPDGLTAIAATA